MNNKREGFIDDVILRLIWNKTGLLFLKPKQGMHSIIPNNLRQVAILVNTLQNMKDHNNDAKVLLRNINEFEQMFINSWIMENLSTEYIKIIEQFLEIDIEFKNQFIIKSIYNLLPNSFKNRMRQPGKIVAMDNIDDAKPFNNRTLEILATEIKNPLNIGIGDIIFAFKMYEEHGSLVEGKKFVFAFKTLYTIYLTKLIKAENDFDRTRILIGGSIYNNDYINNLPNILKLDERYNIKLTNIKEAKDLILEKIKKILSIESDYESIKEIQLIEWFSYFVLNVGTEIELNYTAITNNGFEPYKTNNEVYYVYTIKEMLEKKFVYNIFAFITNLLQPKADLEYLSWGEGKENFLYSQILKWRNEHKTIIPLYSIDFIEEFINNITESYKSYKMQNKSSVDTLVLFIKSMEKLIKDIFKTNEAIYNEEIDNFLKAFNACPIIDCLFNKELYNILFTKEEAEELLLKVSDGDIEINSDKEIDAPPSANIKSNKLDKLEKKSITSKNISLQENQITDNQNTSEKEFTKNTEDNPTDEPIFMITEDYRKFSYIRTYFRKKSITCRSNADVPTKVDEVIKILEKYSKYEKMSKYIEPCTKLKKQVDIDEKDRKVKEENFKKVSDEMFNILNDLKSYIRCEETDSTDMINEVDSTKAISSSSTPNSSPTGDES